mmetsp:Transcript_30886/g.5572  ORF Transcript_30886/g.5572 Transcript_30886/m.5572 type:complete len:93 (-) Transcript_30886:646-924(-)
MIIVVIYLLHLVQALEPALIGTFADIFYCLYNHRKNDPNQYVIFPVTAPFIFTFTSFISFGQLLPFAFNLDQLLLNLPLKPCCVLRLQALHT